MKKNINHQSGIFTPRVLVAFALCSCGVLLGMISLAATPPVETSRTNTSAPSLSAQPPIIDHQPPITSSALPPGVPLPQGYSPVIPLQNPSSGSKQGTLTSGTPTVPSSQASSADSWSIVSSPDLSSTDSRSSLTGITCVSNSDCWAVGYYDLMTGHTGSLRPLQTLIEHWDGASWTLVTSPNTTANLDNVLNAVTCTSASDCWAVGYANGAFPNNQTLIEHWDGSSWTIVTSPNATSPVTGSNMLNGVTCASTNDCLAVGDFFDSNGGGYTLTERWDGSSWTIVVSPWLPATNHAPVNELYGVTCTSASDCWAVGYYLKEVLLGGAISRGTLIEHWDGTSWAVVSSPNSSTATYNFLQSVTCTSASACWAVGYSNVLRDSYSYQTLIERWDGTSWSIVSSPNAGAGGTWNLLNGVACASASDCWAVGDYVNNDVTQYETLVEHWDGTSWAVVNSPTGVYGYTFLMGVSCTAASDCRAVGVLGGVISTSQPAGFALIEQWDGASWSFAKSADAVIPKYPVNPNLNGVTCSSASDCWAVGSSTILGLYYYSLPLIEHWDGNAWTAVPSPNVVKVGSSVLFPMYTTALNSVTCASASECWAVGHYYNGSVDQTLIEHWDGISWAVVSSPTSPSDWSDLTGVICASTTDCWAVGFQIVNNTGYTPLIEHWDGNSWTIAVSPTVPGVGDGNNVTFLSQVACAAASDCWAVGAARVKTNFSTLVPLIEHWNGIAWTIVPNTSTSGALFGVACQSSNDCWAVGYSPTYSTLVERWDGTSWAIVPSPNGQGSGSELLGVTCPSASQCWAAGYTTDPASTHYETLIERWDGTSWTVATSSNVEPVNNILYGLACSSATDCWAAGSSTFVGSGRTLVEHYPGGATPLAAVSRKTHGTAGTFDIDLPITGTAGIECRSGGANGDHSVVLAFGVPVTRSNASVSSGTGSVSSANTSTDGKQVTLNLTGITNAQNITIALTAFDGNGGIASTSVPMGVLLGDVNASGLVDSGDVFLVRQQTGQSANSSNFREDVNASGLIDSGDVFLTRQQTGTSLP